MTGAASRPLLGRVGVWWALGGVPAASLRSSAAELAAAGWGGLWFGELPGFRDPFVQAALLLDATERLPVATGIASVYGRDAVAARGSAEALNEAFDDRFVLGLGVSHRPTVAERGTTYGRPLPAMRGYLDGYDAAAYRGAAPSQPTPVVLAALRPGMLRLAAARTAGAHTYFMPAAHTARARATLGPDALLAVEVSVALEADPAAARERARRFVAPYLQLPNYANALRELGYGDDELARPTDRLLDDLVAWGDPASIAARVEQHLAAGADHVCVQPIASFATARAWLAELAPVLLR